VKNMKIESSNFKLIKENTKDISAHVHHVLVPDQRAGAVEDRVNAPKNRYPSHK